MDSMTPENVVDRREADATEAERYSHFVCEQEKMFLQRMEALRHAPQRPKPEEVTRGKSGGIGGKGKRKSNGKSAGKGKGKASMRASNGKSAAPKTKVGAWEAAGPKAGKGKGGGEDYVNRTGNSNVHVNVTMPEAPRSYSTVFPNRPKARVPTGHEFKVKRNHNKSPKGRNKPRQRVQPTAGRPSSFYDAVIDGVNNAVSHPQVKALRNLAGVVRDGVLCMHFALYLTVMCMMAAVMHYVYSVASVMLAGEVRARLLTFGIGLMPGLVVHLCPSLTRISVRVQSTWNALVRGTDHLVAANGVPMWNNAAGNDGGRHNMENARNFAIHRPPVMNRFWLLLHWHHYSRYQMRWHPLQILM